MRIRHVLYQLSDEGTPFSLPQTLKSVSPEKTGVGFASVRWRWPESNLHMPKSAWRGSAYPESRGALSARRPEPQTHASLPGKVVNPLGLAPT